MKESNKLERVFKGVANHRRIDIICLVKKKPDISVQDISNILRCNFKTISEHTHRLVAAGLLNKKYRGRQVIHRLSPYGEKIYQILKTF